MDFEQVDFLTERGLIDDPYPYYDFLRQCPVRRVPPHGVVAVTGYDEATATWRDEDAFSSCNSFGGPFPGLPVPPDGDDITELIERYRDVYPISEHLVTFDPPHHTKHRALLMRLITPRRLQENEAFMWRLADRLIDEFVEQGRCEFIQAYAYPFSLLTIADLLGVPEADHQRFRSRLEAHVAGALDRPASGDPFEFMNEFFADYVDDRRRAPRQDVLTKLALARFPDGSIPEVIDVVRIAAFLFAAGQGTTAHLLGSLLQRLADRPDLQDRLRAERDRITDFVEETLRIESPVKANFRLVRRSTRLGRVDLPAGTTVMIMPGAANRDGRRFDGPDEFRLDRPNVREHLAFGRGAHACPGGPLSRAEARVSLERLLDRLADIRIADAEHGPPGARRYRYDPSFMLRGLQALDLEFTPID